MFDHVVKLATGYELNITVAPPLMSLIGECGGNMRLFEVVIQAMCWATSTPETLNAGWKWHFKQFFDSQSVELVNKARDRVFTILEKLPRHFVNFEQLCLPVNATLHAAIFEYFLTGDMVDHSASFTTDWTVGAAEEAGYIYLRMHPSNEKVFQIVLPFLYLRKFTLGGGAPVHNLRFYHPDLIFY